MPPACKPIAVVPLRVSRVVADLARAEAFYRGALGFRRIGAWPLDPILAAMLGAGDATARQVVLRLGAQEIALVQFEPPGAPYPADRRSNDLWFQHLAIVVSDMGEAWRRLSVWVPELISVCGPQTLPPRNGSVVALKFRDPDGHPLELIHFPAGQGRAGWQDNAGESPFLGIDHSAIAVSACAESQAFYEELGFSAASRSENFGPAQARLDGLAGARVTVIGLRPPDDAAMGLELLGYTPPGRPMPAMGARDIAADWVTLLVPGLCGGTPLSDGTSAKLLCDPDGHKMLLVKSSG